MEQPPIQVEKRGPVTVIAICRPHVRNALDRAASEAMETAIDAYEADDNARVAVLTGGREIFSAGADLKAAEAGKPPAATERRGNFGFTRTPPEKPIIAAVEGLALGGGFELALACDLIVASRTGQFGLPEVSRGVLAAGGGLIRLVQRLPLNFGLNLALTGRSISADALHAMGLIARLCEPGEALTTAMDLANQIAANAPLAVRAAKRVMLHAARIVEEDVWRTQDVIVERLRTSEDYREGVSAFAEKRVPQWKGR